MSRLQYHGRFSGELRDLHAAAHSEFGDRCQVDDFVARGPSPKIEHAIVSAGPR